MVLGSKKAVFIEEITDEKMKIQVPGNFLRKICIVNIPFFLTPHKHNPRADFDDFKYYFKDTNLEPTDFYKKIPCHENYVANMGRYLITKFGM